MERLYTEVRSERERERERGGGEERETGGGGGGQTDCVYLIHVYILAVRESLFGGCKLIKYFIKVKTLSLFSFNRQNGNVCQPVLSHGGPQIRF